MLIVVVLVLMVVTVAGLMATRSALIEQQIATNDKTFKMTWHATDAVVDGLMPELIEQNITNRGFGTQATPFNYGNTNNLDIYTSEFYLNETCAIPSETNRDVEMSGLSQTTVSVVAYGVTELTPGNAIQLPEGYHGRGKGLAGGGAQIKFVMRGLGRGPANSRARVSSGWRHLIN
jgi:Tfp pilus assembly protein PilX